MILRIEDLRNMANKILTAIDKSEITKLTETLELKTEGTNLYMSIANSDYRATVKFDIGENVPLHATVNADKFLKLISYTTAETVDFSVLDNSLSIKGNGTYKLPLIYEGDALLELPMIPVGEVSSEFDIEGNTLYSIDVYNSKELAKKFPSATIAQQNYYLDEKGAITFTNGACVNNFNIPSTIKVLLPDKLVKLFKLFKEESVHVTLGHIADNDGNIYTRIKFESDVTTIVYKLPVAVESHVSNVPAEAIRKRATNIYPYSVTINKNTFINAMKRLEILMDGLVKPYTHFEFNNESLIMSDMSRENSEPIYYDNEVTNITTPYSVDIDFADLKPTLEGSTEQHITINFGDGQAWVISKENISNVIPEVHR